MTQGLSGTSFLGQVQKKKIWGGACGVVSDFPAGI